MGIYDFFKVVTSNVRTRSCRYEGLYWHESTSDNNTLLLSAYFPSKSKYIYSKGRDQYKRHIKTSGLWKWTKQSDHDVGVESCFNILGSLQITVRGLSHLDGEISCAPTLLGSVTVAIETMHIGGSEWSCLQGCVSHVCVSALSENPYTFVPNFSVWVFYGSLVEIRSCLQVSWLLSREFCIMSNKFGSSLLGLVYFLVETVYSNTTFGKFFNKHIFCVLFLCVYLSSKTFLDNTYLKGVIMDVGVKSRLLFLQLTVLCLY